MLIIFGSLTKMAWPALACKLVCDNKHFGYCGFLYYIKRFVDQHSVNFIGYSNLI